MGVFNALSNDVYATVRDSVDGRERDVLTQPFSNYNIMVLDQSLKNNSYVSLINTNVTRWGSTYDANVTGGLFRFANKKNSYAVDGRVVYSRRRGTGFGSETRIDDQNGYKYQVGISKISGNFTWNAGPRHRVGLPTTPTIWASCSATTTSRSTWTSTTTSTSPSGR